MPRESGRTVRGRPRIGHVGNGRLRTTLYMATLSAACPPINAFHGRLRTTLYMATLSAACPPINAFHDRLRATGKPMKVARCAARKMLHLARVHVTKQQHVDPTKHHHPISARPPGTMGAA